MKRFLILLLVLAAASHAQSDTAKLFEDAAIAREEAARIWENLDERIRAAEAYAEAAVSWERAAKAWEVAGEKAKATNAWTRFREAISKRDQAELTIEVIRGADQLVRVGRLSDSIVVRVMDKAGRPIDGVKVLFDISSRPSTAGGTGAVREAGGLESSEVATDSAGLEEIFQTPRSRFVATFLGTADFLPARALGRGFRTELGEIDQAHDLSEETEIDLMVRPDDVVMTPGGPCVIRTKTFRGTHTLYGMELPSGRLIHALEVHTKDYAIGDQVSANLLPGHNLNIFP